MYNNTISKMLFIMTSVVTMPNDENVKNDDDDQRHTSSSPECYTKIITVSYQSSLSKKNSAPVGTPKNNVDFHINDLTIFLSNHRFRLYEKVSAFVPARVAGKNLGNGDIFDLERGTVVGILPQALSYVVRYDEYSNEYTTQLSQQYVFKAPSLVSRRERFFIFLFDMRGGEKK
ncbi:hypothetical protein RFI_21574 [Reticulomyxa filosa]|uniref:Uncharacterized protein n=1 Tax=Reticulomyxa filosa TaxID=46433 RepID=X6MP64_RETFI|nr:hypothetical protein RFI_21574 [Reticulomyxa filosa]|eukprot:ETO15793.1 hypothetical protein RFI_21574 [Reticulomyxa filosa]